MVARQTTASVILVIRQLCWLSQVHGQPKFWTLVEFMNWIFQKQPNMLGRKSCHHQGKLVWQNIPAVAWRNLCQIQWTVTTFMALFKKKNLLLLLNSFSFFFVFFFSFFTNTVFFFTNLFTFFDLFFSFFLSQLFTNLTLLHTLSSTTWWNEMIQNVWHIWLSTHTDLQSWTLQLVSKPTNWIWCKLQRNLVYYNDCWNEWLIWQRATFPSLM